MRLLIYLTLSVMCCSISTGQKTTRPKLVLDHSVTVSATDTIIAEKGFLSYAGYDKAINSMTESVFVTNNTDYDIVGIKMTLAYFDTTGRQLHTRQWTARCQLPPGETRVIDIRAWDKQNAWYYKGTRSSHSRYKSGSPYDVKIKTDCILVKKP